MGMRSRYRRGQAIGTRYMVQRIAPLGGTAEVYLCSDLKTGSYFALKTIQDRFLADLRIRDMLKSETSTWIKMGSHPNIVRCFIYETLDSQPFLILEWVASREHNSPELRRWLGRGLIDKRLAIDFGIDICRGLVHANNMEPAIVHGDLKPENVLIGAGRVAKITDFGLAKTIQKVGTMMKEHIPNSNTRQDLTDVYCAVGTPSYMAPEQWLNAEQDNRTDVYALGCILYEMLEGECPFNGLSPDELRLQHLEDSPPSLKRVRDVELQSIVFRCLAKERGDRYDGPRELLDDLVQIYRRQFGEPRPVPTNIDLQTLDLLNCGWTYHRLGEYEAALATFNRVLDMDPEYAEAYSDRATTYYRMNCYQDALVDFDKAIELNRNAYQPYSGLGNVYAALGRYEESLSCLSEAISIMPNSAQCHVNRAQTFVEMKRLDDAIDDCNQAIAFDPNLAQAYSLRGYIRMAQEEYEDAFSDISRSVALDPTMESTHMILGSLLMDEAFRNREKRRESTLKKITQAIGEEAMKNLHTYIGDKLCESKTTHDWSEYAAKGLAMTSIGHYEKAIQCFKKGLELQPREYSLWDNLGHALMMQRRHVEACKCFRKSIALNPTSAIAWINLGNVMGREGKYNKALEYYERALDYEPDNEHAKFGSNQAHQLLYESKTRNQERNQQSPP